MSTHHLDDHHAAADDEMISPILSAVTKRLGERMEAGRPIPAVEMAALGRLIDPDVAVTLAAVRRGEFGRIAMQVAR